MIAAPDPKAPYANLPEPVRDRAKALEEHYGREIDDTMVRLTLPMEDDERLALNDFLSALTAEYRTFSGIALQDMTNTEAMKCFMKTHAKILLKKMDHAAEEELNAPDRTAKIPALTGAKSPEDARDMLRMMTKRNRGQHPADRLKPEELAATIPDEILPPRPN